MENFESLWQKHTKPLVGKKIFTATGAENIINAVTEKYIVRISSKGNLSKIKKDLIEAVYNDLIREKSITRTFINNKYGKRCSSIVTVVLAEFPTIDLETFPVIKLKIATELVSINA
ncbi:hypothetical protein ACVW0P_000799 [Mucilaginibacter sp. UYNi724]